MLQTDEFLAGAFLMWCVRLTSTRAEYWVIRGIYKINNLTYCVLHDEKWYWPLMWVWICWHRYFNSIFLQFLTILLLLPYVSCIVTVFMWLRLIILQRYNICYLWISVTLIGPAVKHRSLFYWMDCFNYNSTTERKICTVAGNNRGKMPRAFGWLPKCC